MLSSIKVLRKYTHFHSFQCSSQFSGISNGSVLKSNIDVSSKEYQVSIFLQFTVVK